MSFILTQPTGSGANGLIASPGDILVPTGITSIVDSIEGLTCKWIVSIRNETESVISSVEVMALNRFGINPEHNEYGHVGDEINYSIEVDMNIGKLVLKITNNESFDVTVNAVQIRTV